MADDNKDLMDLLDKLKKMDPGEAKGNTKEDKADANDDKIDSINDLLPKGEREDIAEIVEKKVNKEPKKMGVLTGEIYRKIAVIEEDIRSKEEKIDLDLQKLEDLVQALGEREAELTEKEAEVAVKDTNLSKQLAEFKKVREQLQSVLQ
jgi:hypothetical protein